MTEEERYVYWKNQIQEQKDSDLSINAFCKKQKIGYSTFYNWSRKVKERFNTAFLEIKDTVALQLKLDTYPFSVS